MLKEVGGDRVALATLPGKSNAPTQTVDPYSGFNPYYPNPNPTVPNPTTPNPSIPNTSIPNATTPVTPSQPPSPDSFNN